MNFYRIKAAARYFLCSRHGRGHGIHSPFVFDLINSVLRKEVPGKDIDAVRYIRDKMYGSGITVRVNDLGTGPVRKSSPGRRLSNIAKRSSVHDRYGRILYNLASRYNGEKILELGTSVGISTIFISRGAPFSRIISIEGCPVLAGIAKENLSEAGMGNVEILTGHFDEQLSLILKKDFRPSMVFVDGNHTGEAAIKYFRLFKKLLPPDSVIVFDDINYSSDMNKGWNEIKSDPQVSLSIDVFQMGMIFFKKGMAKQHYEIRY